MYSSISIRYGAERDKHPLLVSSDDILATKREVSWPIVWIFCIIPHCISVTAQAKTRETPAFTPHSDRLAAPPLMNVTDGPTAHRTTRGRLACLWVGGWLKVGRCGEHGIVREEWAMGAI